MRLHAVLDQFTFFRRVSHVSFVIFAGGGFSPELSMRPGKLARAEKPVRNPALLGPRVGRCVLGRDQSPAGGAGPWPVALE